MPVRLKAPGPTRLRRIWNLAFIASCLIYAAFALFTYGSHPMFGEITVRGTINRDPNLLRLDILREARRKYLPHEQLGRLLDPEQCLQCFSPFSYKRLQTVENGLYRNSHFQPTLFYFLDNNRIPILFANRIGGAPYALVKLLKETIGLKSALIAFHLVVGVLFIFLFGKGTRLLFGASVSIIAMAILAISPVHILNNGPYISIKAVPLALWIYIVGIHARGRLKSFTMIALSSAWFYLVKATALFSFLAAIALTFRRTLAAKYQVALASIIGLAPFVLLSERAGFIQEYYNTAEYLKGSKYAFAAFLDSILLVAHPVTFLEYFLAIDSWHFPFTTGSPTFQDYEKFQPLDRLANLGGMSGFLLLFFLLPILSKARFRWKSFARIYLTLAFFLLFLFLSGHKYFAYSDYFTAALSLVVLINALTIRQLLRWNKTPREWATSRVLITFYALAMVFQLNQFVHVYRKFGPEPTFSYNFYREISADLLERNILNPYMFYVSEFGNLENHSERVLPTYITEPLMENFGVLFEVAKEGFTLLQLKPNWVEAPWGFALTKEDVLRAADLNEVTIEHIRDYSYRGEPKYWLFHFTHRNPGKFAEGPVSIPAADYHRLYQQYIPFR